MANRNSNYPWHSLNWIRILGQRDYSSRIKSTPKEPYLLAPGGNTILKNALLMILVTGQRPGEVADFSEMRKHGQAFPKRVSIRSKGKGKIGGLDAGRVGAVGEAFWGVVREGVGAGT